MVHSYHSPVLSGRYHLCWSGIRPSTHPITHPSTHRGTDLAIDEQHVALPKLYGAPAYARPPRPVEAEREKPFDPDDLPIDGEQAPEEREFAATLPAHTYAPGGYSTVKRVPTGS